MINKEKILEKVGGEEYLIRHLVPSFNTKIRNKNYKSIFSDKDDKPSMSIYQDKGTWKFKSFNTGHQGDAFRMWADYYGLDCKSQFPELLELINREMCLGLDSDLKDIGIVTQIIPEKKESKQSLPSQTLNIQYITNPDLEIAQWQKQYWAQFGISEDILNHFNVKQVGYLSYISHGGRHFSFHYQTKNKVVTAYDIGGKVKVYLPAIAASFIKNDNFYGQKKSFPYKNQTKEDVFGLQQLAAGQLDYILLTAGEKDCMVAYAKGFKNVISLQSENQRPTIQQIKILREKTAVLLSCYDNDKAGRISAKKLEVDFGIVALTLLEDVKDIAEYFQEYKSTDFNSILDEGIARGKEINIPEILPDQEERKISTTARGKIEAHFDKKFEFRYNEIMQEREMRVRKTGMKWDKVNVNELRSHLDRHGISCSLDLISCILKSFFVRHFNPVKDFFRGLKEEELPDDTDYIYLLASYVVLKTNTPKLFNLWYNHLKKWMIRAVRCVLEDDYANKHGLIFCSPKENIGKSYFCEFLCPEELLKYYNSNPIISNDKDTQKNLINNFLIILDELHQVKGNNAHLLKAWFSQRWVKVRFAYQEDDTLAPRIASFLGSTNDPNFLRSDMGYSRWIPVEIDATQFFGEKESIVRNRAWIQAVKIYFENPTDGDLTKEELEELAAQSENFKESSPEKELIQEYFAPSNKEEGEFMTTTYILRDLQTIVGNTIRLTTRMIGISLRELGFERYVRRIDKVPSYGYWVIKTSSPCSTYKMEEL